MNMENIELIDTSSETETYGTVFNKTNALITAKNSLENDNIIKREGKITFRAPSSNNIAVIVKNNMECNTIIVNGKVNFNNGGVMSEETIDISEFEAHINNKDNPHQVKLADIGLEKFTDDYEKEFEDVYNEVTNPTGRKIESWELKGCFTDEGRPLSNEEWSTLKSYKNDNLGLSKISTLSEFKIKENASKVSPGSVVWQYLRAYKETIITTLYPVGSIYINCSDKRNPSDIFGYGTWVNIATGKTLISTGDYAIKATGGAKTITLTTANLPLHTHTATTTTSGAHTHSKGSWEIAGYFQSGGLGRWDTGSAWGAVTKECSNTWGKDHHGGSCINYDIYISRNRSGTTDSKGAHTHNVSSGLNGNKTPTAINIEQSTFNVYMWERTA